MWEAQQGGKPWVRLIRSQFSLRVETGRLEDDTLTNPTSSKRDNYLTEDLKLLLVFVVGCQGGKLLQEHRTRRGGDVQEVLEGLVDGTGGDPGLVCPVADHTYQTKVEADDLFFK